MPQTLSFDEAAPSEGLSFEDAAPKALSFEDASPESEMRPVMGDVRATDEIPPSEPASTLGEQPFMQGVENDRALFGEPSGGDLSSLSPDATSKQDDYAELKRRHEAMREMVSDPFKRAALDEAFISTAKNIGVTVLKDDPSMHLPKVSNAEMQAAFPDSKTAQVVGGIQRGFSGLAEGILSPEGLPMLAPAKVAGTLPKLLGAAFVGQMATSYPEQVKAFADALVSKDWGKAAESGVGVVATPFFVKAGLKGHPEQAKAESLKVAEEIKNIAPLTSEVLKQSAENIAVKEEGKPLEVSVEPENVLQSDIQEAPKTEIVLQNDIQTSEPIESKPSETLTEEATIKETPSDFTQFQELSNQRDAMMKDGTAFDASGEITPEFKEVWQKAEEIKNRNNGLPPESPVEKTETESTDINQGALGDVGMGGAKPSDLSPNPQTATAIKNATVEAERAKRGLPPAMEPARKEFPRAWDEAMAEIDKDPGNAQAPGFQDRLINELRENPRAITDKENALLLHRQIDLQNEYGRATRDLAQAFDDGRMDQVAEENVRVAQYSDALLDLYNINKKVGTETGRGLNARKMLAYEDFSLAKMELEKRAANKGRALTPEERTEVQRLHEKIAETQKAYDDYVSTTDKRMADMMVKDALDKVERDAKKEATYHPSILNAAERIVKGFEKRADTAAARLREKLKRVSSGVDPTIVIDLAEIGIAKLGRKVIDFAKWADAVREQVGKEYSETIEPYLADAFEKSNEMLESEMTRLKVPEKVKRAVKGIDISEKISATKDSISKKMSEGKEDSVSGDIQKLAKMLIEQGVKDRNELIDKVHEVLIESDPTITRREAMDAISGYGKFYQLSKGEVIQKLRDLKGQMQQVAKLEDMQSGQPPLKTGVERRIPSQEESRLIKLVNQAKNEFQIPISNEATQLKSSLDTLKTRLKNRISEFEDKLKRKDFSAKEKRFIKRDEEANRLHFEEAKAKIAWHEALMKDRLANRSVPQKILGNAQEVLNTSRAILTSLDLSAVLRQGGFIALGHPIRAAKSFPAMFRALRSKAGEHAVNEEILARKNYPLYQQSKLYLSEHGQKLSQMEEAYMSRWADKIPLVAASQRAYTTFLNKLRADSFDAMANTLSRDGELTPTEATVISNYVNVSTGRGNVGMKENALIGLNSIFFAPRYVASRFQLLAGQPLYGGTIKTRALIAKEYARFLTGVGIVYALAQMDDDAKIETDPRSSDFAKIKYGKTRLDPLAGLSQSTVLMGRLGSGETKTLKGKVVPIRGEKVPFGTGNSADVIARFLRSKLAPVPGSVVNVLSGKDVVGNPVTPSSELKRSLTPLAMSDILKTMQEQGVPRGTALSILSLFGMGLQNYDERENK